MTPERGRAKYKHWDEYDIKPDEDNTKTSLTRFEYEWPMLHQHYTDVMGKDIGEHSSDWAGEGDLDDLLINGDRAGVEKAEQLLSEINTQLDIEDLGLSMGMSPMGASVSIGHYLAGQLACMRKMIEAESDHCPIRVFVGLGCSASNSVEVQEKRGVACVALAMALSRIRPVELWGFSASSPGGAWSGDEKVHKEHNQSRIDTCVMVKVGMSPFDMSIVSALMSKLVITRGLMYAMAQHYGGDVHSHLLGWCKHSDAQCVGALPTDVVVPQVRADEAAKVWANPVGWVQEELQKAIAQQGQAMRLGMGTATEYQSGT